MNGDERPPTSSRAIGLWMQRTLGTGLELSLARAAVMCEALRKLGIRARPRLAGHRGAEPIASNASESAGPRTAGSR
jgi:hypothetical protein